MLAESSCSAVYLYEDLRNYILVCIYLLQYDQNPTLKLLTTFPLALLVDYHKLFYLSLGICSSKGNFHLILLLRCLGMLWTYPTMQSLLRRHLCHFCHSHCLSLLTVFLEVIKISSPKCLYNITRS